MAGHTALDRRIGVRIPAPQLIWWLVDGKWLMVSGEW